MNFSSRLQILLVEKTDTKFKDADGNVVQRVAARAVLLADDGNVVTVGRLRVPKSLADKVKTGTFRASFALTVPDYGDDKGDIVATLTGLQEEARPAAQPKAA